MIITTNKKIGINNFKSEMNKFKMCEINSIELSIHFDNLEKAIKFRDSFPKYVQFSIDKKSQSDINFNLFERHNQSKLQGNFNENAIKRLNKILQIFNKF